MNKITLPLVKGVETNLGLEESYWENGGVYLNGKGHLSAETTRQARDWLNGILGDTETPRPPLPTKEFALIEAVLKTGGAPVRLSRMDARSGEHTAWQSSFDNASGRMLEWYTDDDIESFEVLFEGIDE